PAREEPLDTLGVAQILRWLDLRQRRAQAGRERVAAGVAAWIVADVLAAGGPGGGDRASGLAKFLTDRGGVLPVLAPDQLDVHGARGAVGRAADRVSLGEEDRVGGPVRERGEPVDAALLPVLAPATAEGVPVGAVARGPAVAPGLATARQARV